MQWLEPAREFRSLIANGESLDALLAVKRRFSAYLLPEENEDPKFRAIAWQSLLWAIWGQASENGVLMRASLPRCSQSASGMMAVSETLARHAQIMPSVRVSGVQRRYRQRCV